MPKLLLSLGVAALAFTASACVTDVDDELDPSELQDHTNPPPEDDAGEPSANVAPLETTCGGQARLKADGQCAPRPRQ